MEGLSHDFRTLIMCIIELVIGILLFINPIGFTTGIIILLGILLTITGAKNIVNYFWESTEIDSQQTLLTKGLLLVCGGLFCIFKSEWFLATFPLLTVFYGVIIFISGVNKAAWTVDMFRKGQRYWFITLIGALLSLLHATIALLHPFESTEALWIFIAIAFIIEAVADFVTFVLGRI